MPIIYNIYGHGEKVLYYIHSSCTVRAAKRLWGLHNHKLNFTKLLLYIPSPSSPYPYPSSPAPTLARPPTSPTQYLPTYLLYSRPRTYLYTAHRQTMSDDGIPPPTSLPHSAPPPPHPATHNTLTTPPPPHLVCLPRSRTPAHPRSPLAAARRTGGGRHGRHRRHWWWWWWGHAIRGRRAEVCPIVVIILNS